MRTEGCIIFRKSSNSDFLQAVVAVPNNIEVIVFTCNFVVINLHLIPLCTFQSLNDFEEWIELNKTIGIEVNRIDQRNTKEVMFTTFFFFLFFFLL